MASERNNERAGAGEGVEGASPRPAPAPAAAGGSSPPLLTGGVLQGADHVGVDWLTVTVGDSAGPAGEALRLLKANSTVGEPGNPKRGFERSELRLIMGGDVWRRWKPRQKSKEHGRAYESWECSGPEAAGLAELIAGHPCKPTRIDIAFDVPVPEDYLSDHFIEWVRPHVKRRRLKIGIAGEDDVNTRYIGGKQSERRIRVYRKDLESSAWALAYGPTLRVEFQLRDNAAVAWWQVFASMDKQSAWACASGLIESMTGYLPIPAGVDLPEVATEPGLAEAERYALFIKRHAGELASFDLAGLPVLEHVRHFLESGKNRMREWRIRQRTEALHDLPNLIQTVEALLSRAN